MNKPSIDDLAADLHAAIPVPASKSLGVGLATGAAVTCALTAAALGFQPGLGALAGAVPLAVKASYALVLGSGGFLLALQLAHPGRVGAIDKRLVIAPVVFLVVVALLQLAVTPLSEWPSLVFGKSWAVCPLRIVALSVPVFVALTVAMRAQAPVQLRRAGASIGLASGATAAAVYALACNEAGAPFVLVWYTLGIAIATGAGFLAGPRLLRW